MHSTRARKWLHLAEYARKLKNYPQLLKFGYEPRKPNWISKRFDWVSFSIILHGTGHIEAGTGTIAIHAPSFFVKVPPCTIAYGPDTTWSEVFFSFKPVHTSQLINSWGFKPGETTHGPIHEITIIHNRLREFGNVAKFPGLPGAIDTLDRIAELILLECLFHSKETPLTDEDLRIHQAEAYIRDNYTKDIAIDALASRFAFSRSSFRRRWKAVFPFTPVELVTRIRINEAAKLLVESNYQTARIAHMVGYRDPLYFSRVFRSVSGQSPRAYQSANRHTKKNG